MSFKYINPGYAELLDVAGGTTIQDAAKSKTGVSFWQPTRSKGINIAEIPTELYGKFDVYLPSGPGLDINVYITFCGYCGVNISGYSREWTIYGYYAGTSYFSNKAQVIYDAVNTIWFNAKPTDAGDYLTVKANGVEIGKKTGISFNTTSRYIEIYSNSRLAPISNLILSDTEIHPREQVVTLPVKATETTMTANGDGSYTANAANQQIMQSVDVDSLLAEYGEDSEIRGISLMGNPAYRTAEGLAYLTALEDDGTTVTEIGTSEAKQNTSNIVMQGYAKNMKLPALAGYKFGWKAGVGS